jgi:hypothetical protein
VARRERGEELVVRHDARVEVELERFAVIAQVVIRRIDAGAAGIADARADDSAVTPEPGVGRPESTEREGGRLGHRLGGVEEEHAVMCTPPRLAFTWQTVA